MPFEQVLGGLPLFLTAALYLTGPPVPSQEYYEAFRCLHPAFALRLLS